MKLGKIFLVLAASISVISSVHAAPPNWRSVDARALDIAGVKLGMDYDEAIAVTASHFKLSPKEIKDLKAKTHYVDDFLAKSKLPGFFTLRKDGITFEVGFSGRSPSNKAQSVGVTSINYGLTSTPENKSMLKEAAFAKYGRPSDDRPKAIFMWCSEFVPGVTCKPKGPSLTHGPGYLRLQDHDRYEEERKKYYNEINTQKQKPSI